MILPLAPNSARSPAVELPATRTETDSPVASFICEATVRCQISSYSRRSSEDSRSLATWAGVRKLSPAGRMASCASCAFFTLLA